MEKEIKSYVHVALVLDASGSMEGIRSATIESLKKFFGGLKSEEDKTPSALAATSGSTQTLAMSSRLPSPASTACAATVPA